MPKTKRDTVTYALFDGRRKVYIGSTNDPDRRIKEHAAEGKRLTRMEVTSRRMTEEGAHKKEGAQLATYRRTHGRKLPRYNKDEDG